MNHLYTEELMDSEKFEQYLTDRYEDQISWYSNTASFNKRLYQIFQWGVIIFSAIVPVLIVSIPNQYQSITIIISIILAIATAGLKTFKFSGK